jgi:glucose dehydrogenase
MAGRPIGDKRPGDNLYTSSTLALDVATGAIKGYFQYHPNDSWDWDEVSPPILVDYRRGGRTVKGLIDVARDGYLWFLERGGGPIRFVEGQAVRLSERLPRSRSEDRSSRHRSRTHTGDRQARRLLSQRARRQELAADCLQSEDADDLHPRQQQHLRIEHGR